uniref:Src kinase-associated phosphoprotein 1 n=1 Tax=Catharus ustulatus TaxID=91951 RepID=A0A8C3UR08_CATUS
IQAEDYLAQGLQEEPLSARAREQRDAILRAFQRLKARLEYEGQDGSDENPSWNFGPSHISEASFPPEFQHEGENKKKHLLLFLIFLGFSRFFLFFPCFPEPSFFGSDWHKRWCVLTQRSFLYYANEKSKHPKGSFPIERYQAHLDSQLRKDSRKKCCFQLFCPGKRSYEFTAPSPAEAQDWVEQIQFLLKGESGADPTFWDLWEVVSHLDWGFPSTHTEFGVIPWDFPSFLGFFHVCFSTVLRCWDYSSYYQGLWDCRGDNPDELSFQRGDLIRILSKEYPGYGWWVGELGQEIGIVPKEFLMPAFELEQ